MKKGEIISLEQLRKMLHVSKRKAAWMLQNGIIPCEIRNTATHRYSVRREDVLAYLGKSEYEKRREIPVGIFTSKKNNPRSIESQGSNCGGYFDISDEDRKRFKEMMETEFENVPDVLTIDEVVDLCGYSRHTILDYIKKKYLFTVSIMSKYYISKLSLIEFLAKKRAFDIRSKADQHKELILKYLRQKLHSQLAKSQIKGIL